MSGEKHVLGAAGAGSALQRPTAADSRAGTRSPGRERAASQGATRVDLDGGPLLEQVELNIEDQFTFLKAICLKRQTKFEEC